MLVHLNTPTLYNVLALVAYALNILFHVIAYGTNDWCHFTLHGRRVKLGLWQGCIHEQSRDSWDCSDSVFGEDIFMSGSDWHIGARVLMTISLVVLFLMEFALIGYACIRRLQPYKGRLSGIVMGMSFSLVIMTLLVLLIVGTETAMLEEGKVSGCYGLEILNVLLSSIIGILIFLDRKKSKNKQNQLIENKPSSPVTIGKTSIDSSFNQEQGSVISRSTRELGFLSVNNDFEKASTKSLSGSIGYSSNFTMSTDVISYQQEPMRRTSSVSSVESRV